MLQEVKMHLSPCFSFYFSISSVRLVSSGVLGGGGSYKLSAEFARDKGMRTVGVLGVLEGVRSWQDRQRSFVFCANQTGPADTVAKIDEA
jgi:hypothetical protein